MSRAGSHKTEEEWQQALDSALALYPEIKTRDMVEEFTADLDLMGRIIGDVLKLQKAEDNPHRRGRRTVPQVSRDELWLLFEGFSTENFEVALQRLMVGRSIRQVAIKCGISHMTLYRLSKGEVSPSMETLEAIAKAFNKSPYYFSEYRAGMIALGIKKELLENPNKSINIFKETLGRKSVRQTRNG